MIACSTLKATLSSKEVIARSNSAVVETAQNDRITHSSCNGTYKSRAGHSKNLLDQNLQGENKKVINKSYKWLKKIKLISQVNFKNPVFESVLVMSSSAGPNIHQ